jgi:four helix bundle protein
MSASFRDLRGWNEAMDLASCVYRSTAGFPKYELYGQAQQMRRAAVSVPSNIAEGKGKGHTSNREFVHFLLHARGSLWELQTQILIAEALQYILGDRRRERLGKAEDVSRALSGLISVSSSRTA